MVGTLYRTRRSKHIYACVSISYEHVPIMTMVCITDGDTWVVKGLRELDRYFEPLQPKEEE
jgi:endonuclease YncB( thermonuclease family)